MSLQQGIHPGVPMAEYLADPCEPFSLSSGVAYTLLTRSPLHARQDHPKLSPAYQPDDSSRAELGSASHRVLLEGTTDGIVWIPFDNYKKGAAQDMRDQARVGGQIPVLAALEKDLRQMVGVALDTLAENEDIEIDLKDGDAEQTVVWIEDGCYCRIRPDWMSKKKRALLNYKTARSAEPQAFIRAMVSQGYDFSAAFYERGMKANGFEAEEFFLAQEIAPPYACSIVGLDPAMREIAENKVDLAIKLWRQTIESNRWIGYPNRVHYASPTNWQMAEHEERLTADERIELATQA